MERKNNEYYSLFDPKYLPKSPWIQYFTSKISLFWVKHIDIAKMTPPLPPDQFTLLPQTSIQLCRYLRDKKPTFVPFMQNSKAE